MLLLSCTNLTHGYDATPLFENVEFEIHAGERVIVRFQRGHHVVHGAQSGIQHGG